MPTRAPRFEALRDSARQRPVIAVDLGYSSKRPTCGVATSILGESKCYRFGDAVTRVVDLCVGQPKAVLVLEAVLSTSHNSQGNPCDRGGFEKGRSWYYGPGAVTFLAAMRFLAELDKRLPERLVIDIAEAFLSNKAIRSRHESDAALIAKTFWKRRTEHLSDDVKAILPIIGGVPPVRSFAYAP